MVGVPLACRGAVRGASTMVLPDLNMRVDLAVYRLLAAALHRLVAWSATPAVADAQLPAAAAESFDSEVGRVAPPAVLCSVG